MKNTLLIGSILFLTDQILWLLLVASNWVGFTPTSNYGKITTFLSYFSSVASITLGIGLVMFAISLRKENP